MDKIKEYAKSIVTFLATIAINMVISLLQGEQPWPQTQEEWIRYIGTAFTAALATAVPRNKITQGQLDTAQRKGEIVGDAVVVPKAERAAEPAPAAAPVVVAPPPSWIAHPAAVEPEAEPEPAVSVIDQIIAEKQRRS